MQKNAVILFEPDGYVVSGPKLMGRHAAGQAFLRAAVAGRDGETLAALTPHKASAEVFGSIVRELDPQASAHWYPADRLDLIEQNGTLYIPQPELASVARVRLRRGCAAYSLTGVTHTTASHGAMEAITGLLTAPVMPWDALICTSTAVQATAKALLEAEAESLRWRLGKQINFLLPQFPVIPLGVHSSDYAFSPEDRQASRTALGLAEDEVAVLFVGRLSFHAKAHPHLMYQALQEAARKSGKKVVLIQAGWFANEHIEKSFREGAASSCPDVRCLFLDGREADIRRQCWSSADVFVSLSDNVQETFGLTPIEAMAAGLPVVVTDWNGYKDTVRDGIDGYRIPTTMPPPGLGGGLAMRHELDIDSYDLYCGLNCMLVGIDLVTVTDRFAALFNDPALRQRLGEAGRARAREMFDWAVIYRSYQQLWAELGQMRTRALADPAWQALVAGAPKASPARMDPTIAFGHYPTRHILPDTMIKALPGASETAYEALSKEMLFSFAAVILPAPAMVGKALVFLAMEGAVRVDKLQETLQISLGDTIVCVAILIKMGLVAVSKDLSH